MNDLPNHGQTPDHSNGRVTQESISSGSPSLGRRAGRWAISGIVTLAFLGFGYLGIRGFLNRQWLIAFTCVPASWMCIPWVDHNSSIRERSVMSIAAAFAFGGLVGSVALYFLMFRFAWFEALFNDKGTGPGGLVLFSLAGIAGGGVVGGIFASRM